MIKIAVITGASSGIGLSTAEALLNQGCKVYDLSRRDFVHEKIIHIKTDVTDEASVSNAISQIISENGKIDILINNAGFGISGAVEFTDTNEAKKLFDVNFFGTVNVNRAIIPFMRERGQGRILNISSVAAVAPIPFQAFYSSSKSAVLTYSSALQNELKPFGIRVSAVLPGDIKTPFTDNRSKSGIGDDVYNGRISRSVSKMENDERSGMSPEKAGDFICKAALSKRNKTAYTIGFSYKAITALIKILPRTFINKLIKILYAN